MSTDRVTNRTATDVCARFKDDNERSIRPFTIMSNNDDTRFDGLYLNAIQQSAGIEPFLESICSFLARKTDFFDGPQGNGSEHAIATTNAILQKYADLASKKEKKQTKKQTKKQVIKKKVEDDDVIEVGSDGQFDVASSPTPDTTSTTPTPSTDDTTTKSPPPIGNGGTVPGKYVWTQLLSELSIIIPVPPHTRGKDLMVTIAKKHLTAGLRGQPPIVDAPLTKDIIVDDSFWTVEDGNRLVMNLQKLNQMEWWSAVCVGDPEINVQDIQPENSSLGTYCKFICIMMISCSQLIRRFGRSHTHNGRENDVRSTTKGHGEANE